MPPASADARGPAVADAPPPDGAPTTRRPLVVFLGDSLTAGFGLAETRPTRPARRAAGRRRRADRGVNAGVSGDTTAGGVARLDWILRQKPDVVVVGLGANDGLRGLPLEMTEGNLRAIVERSRARAPGCCWSGCRSPPTTAPSTAELR